MLEGLSGDLMHWEKSSHALSDIAKILSTDFAMV